jgi:hypothetical protein
MFDSQNAAYLDNPALHGHRRMQIWDSLLTRPPHLEGALVASLVAYHAQCPFSGKQESRPEVLPSADIAIKIMQDPKTPPEARELALFTQFFRAQTQDDLRALAQCLREIDGRGGITPIQTAFAQRFTIPLSGGNN